MAQTEDYVEYSRHGAVIKGQEKAIARSKYEEDVLINNHTVSTTYIQCNHLIFVSKITLSLPFQCIWGSYWKDGYWGYKCCHSLVKQSYCTGDAGRKTAVRTFGLNATRLILISDYDLTYCKMFFFLQNTSCVPFDEGLEDENEEAPKTLLEVYTLSFPVISYRQTVIAKF